MPGDQAIAAQVSLLRLPKGPADVARLVVAIVINAIDGVPRGWLVTGFGQKPLKRFKPTLDPPAPIAKPHAVARIDAALGHIFPALVFRRAALAVSGAPLSLDINLQAPAAASGSLSQIARSNHYLCLALTKTEPKCPRPVFGNLLQDGESAKALARQIYLGWHQPGVSG